MASHTCSLSRFLTRYKESKSQCVCFIDISIASGIFSLSIFLLVRQKDNVGGQEGLTVPEGRISIIALFAMCFRDVNDILQTGQIGQICRHL